MAEASEEDIEIIPVQVDLRRKAPPLPAFRQKSDPIAAAEAAIGQLSHQFKNWMTSEVDNLNETWKSIKADGMSEESHDALFRAAHDIRGQAETLGFPLAGQVASSLCVLMESIPEPANLPISLMEKHVQSMCAIVNERAEEEHPIGRELVATLREVTHDYLENL